MKNYKTFCCELKKAIKDCNQNCPENNKTIVTSETNLPISRSLCKYYITMFINFKFPLFK